MELGSMSCVIDLTSSWMADILTIEEILPDKSDLDLECAHHTPGGHEINAERVGEHF
jgi:hypothetical protein